jgi:hypothetical protein
MCQTCGYINTGVTLTLVLLVLDLVVFVTIIVLVTVDIASVFDVATINVARPLLCTYALQGMLG